MFPLRLKPLLPDLLCLLLLAALPPLVFWQVWAPNPADRVMFGGDILMGAYPVRVFIHRLFDQGMAPLWNPYQLGGMPLLGDVQTAPYYLPNLLLDALYRGRDIPYLAFELLVIAHYALGALFLYAYLRQLGLRPAAALVGAASFEFNGFFVGHRGHSNMLAVVVWLPGVLWLLDAAWSTPHIKRAVIWAALASGALSQMIMAGHPQATLYCALTIAAYAAYRWAGVLRGQSAGWRVRLRVPALLAVVGLLAGGLAAVALLPAAELLGRSLRSELSYDFAGQYSLLPRNLIGLLVPDFLGWSTTEYRIYAGVLTLALAAAGWIAPARARPERRFFGVAAVVALVVALGGFTVLHGLIYRFVPGFASIRVSTRAFFIANLSLSVLAAFGAEQLLGTLAQAELRRLLRLVRALTWLLGGLALLGGAGYALLLRSYHPVGEAFFFSANLFDRQPSDDAFTLLTQTANACGLFVLLLAAAVAVLWGRATGRLVGRTLAATATTLMVLDLATFAPYHDTLKADPDTAHFTIKQYATTLLEAPWQIADQQELIGQLAQLPDGERIDNAAEVLPDNYSAVWRTPFATGYNILDLQERFALLTQWPQITDTTRRDLLGIRYVLTASDNDDPPEADARLLLENSQGNLWERASRPNYATFSTRFRPAETTITINGLLSIGQPLDTQPTLALDGGELRPLLQQLWPEALEPALAQIGTTGVSSPVDISVLAGGKLAYSAVIVDGVTVTPQQRGIVLAQIDPRDGRVVAATGFDTYRSEAESDRLAAAIGAMPQGTIVALATYDEGTTKLNTAARAALGSLGARVDPTGQTGAAYALIGVKGEPPGTAVERIDQQAVVLDVGVGALSSPPDPQVTSTVLIYQPDRIALRVENRTRGLLTVSEPVYPGWEAYVDGLPTPILRANGLQRAVILAPALPGKPHEVLLIYRPLSARLGMALSLLSLSLIGGFLIGAGGKSSAARQRMGSSGATA